VALTCESAGQWHPRAAMGPHEDLAGGHPWPVRDELVRQVAARYGNTGLLIAETATAGLAHGRQLWFGNPRNIGIPLREVAEDLGVAIHLARA